MMMKNYILVENWFSFEPNFLQWSNLQTRYFHLGIQFITTRTRLPKCLKRLMQIGGHWSL